MIYLTVAILFLSVAKKLSIAQKTTLRMKDFFIKCEKIGRRFAVSRTKIIDSLLLFLLFQKVSYGFGFIY